MRGFKKYLKMYRGLNSLNVIGLSISLCTCIIVFQIASFELSFNNEYSSNVQRVYTEYMGSTSGYTRGVPTAAAELLKNQIAGVKHAALFHTFFANAEPLRSVQGKGFENDQIVITSNEFFDVFPNYRWLAGNQQTALTAPFSVVITESVGHRYFGPVTPYEMLNQTVRYVQYQDTLLVNVSGVVADLSFRTDLDFLDFVSYSTVEKSWLKKAIQFGAWGSISSNSQLFILLEKGVNAKTILQATDGYSKAHPGQFTNRLRFHPIDDLHFNTDVGIFDNSRSVIERSTLTSLIWIACFILALATANFISIQTVEMIKQTKNMGIKKLLGDSNMRIIANVIMKNAALAFSAIALSLLMAALSIPQLRNYIPPGMELNFGDPVLISFLVLLGVALAVTTASYPAFLLSSVKPIIAAKNETLTSLRTPWIQKSLVVGQFVVSQILIVTSLTIVLQVQFLLRKDLGFSPAGVIILNAPWWQEKTKVSTLRNELLHLASVSTLTQSSPPTASSNFSRDFQFVKGAEKISLSANLKSVDTSFLSFYSVHLLAGNNLHPSDTSKEFIINETFLHTLGFSNPRDAIGAVIGGGTIVGVVNDFHIESLHKPIIPVALNYQPQNTFGIRIAEGGNVVGSVKSMEKVWHKIYPDDSFEFSFISDDLRQLYEDERRIESISNVATSLAVVIACLGLIGLVSQSILRRTREIGVRKVFGGSFKDIFWMLLSDFLKFVCLALLISVPIGYYVSSSWLSKFPYHTESLPLTLFFAGVLSICLAIVCVSIQTFQATRISPAKALRAE